MDVYFPTQIFRRVYIKLHNAQETPQTLFHLISAPESLMFR